jgi:30S ribosomal protein S31
MGRGDKKTKRGKIANGSFGKSRPAREITRKAGQATKAGDKKAGE